jgi:hypothetical protein
MIPRDDFATRNRSGRLLPPGQKKKQKESSGDRRRRAETAVGLHNYTRSPSAAAEPRYDEMLMMSALLNAMDWRTWTTSSRASGTPSGIRAHAL